MSALLLPYTYDCFVCGVNNPHGLGLRFHVKNGEDPGRVSRPGPRTRATRGSSTAAVLRHGAG